MVEITRAFNKNLKLPLFLLQKVIPFRNKNDTSFLFNFHIKSKILWALFSYDFHAFAYTFYI